MTTLDHAIALAIKTQKRTNRKFVVYFDCELSIQSDPSHCYFYIDDHTWQKEVNQYGKAIQTI